MDKVIFKPKILVRKSKINKIAKKVGCCDAAVYKALAYETRSQLSNDIRNTTTEFFGGILVPKYPYLIEE